MNCIEKMYKEIEYIIEKEKLEFEKLAMPIKEIKHGFSDEDFFEVEKVEYEPVDYLKMIELEGDWDKKYFSVEKAKDFILFIFKKYFCFHKSTSGTNEFLNQVQTALDSEKDLLEILVSLENSLIEYLNGETEELKEFFTNPYNALFSDEKGYFAVIKKGKFSDVKRPIGFNPNQMKKIIKENFDAYLIDFKQRFSSEKEFNAYVNNFKAEVNKSNLQPLELENEMKEKLSNFLITKGVTKQTLDSYFENKGLQLIKQGNYYFRKMAYDQFAEYKKIEFRY